MKTKSINHIRTLIFFQSEINLLPASLQGELNQLVKEGWTFSVINQTRGYARKGDKSVNIPHWILSEQYKKNRKFIWYVAHELAHAIHMRQDNWHLQKPHGQEFMQILKRICPQDCIHHELGYQPLNAKEAGIVHAVQQKGV